MASYQILSKTKHRNYSYKLLSNFSLFKKEHICRICLAELRSIITTIPIAFLKEENGSFYLGAVLSVIPNNNSFIDPNGNWTGTYLPANFRTFPFRFKVVPEKKDKLMCFDNDMNCVLKLENKDQKDFLPLFDDSGEPSKPFSEALMFMKFFDENLTLTNKLTAELEDEGLIEEWKITLDFKDGQKNLQGFYKIDEKKLSNLPPKKITSMHKSKSLELAYAQIFSLLNLPLLAQPQTWNNVTKKDNQNNAVAKPLSLRDKVLEKQNETKKQELDDLVQNLLSE